MKVISGKLKGRNLLTIQNNKNIRPTKNIIREAVFDVLRSFIEDVSVLDLFAGTGAMGIEAISEGAKEAVFVESEYEASMVIKDNLKSLGIESVCQVIKGSVEKKILDFKNSKFGLIFLDPPYNYNSNRIFKILSNIVDLKIIEEGGIVVLEHTKDNKVQPFDGLTLYKEKKYGKSWVSYFKH